MARKHLQEREFINQLKTFDFELSPEQELDDNFHLFAKGIELWTNHELTKAKTIFEQLHLTAQTRELAHYVPIALLGVLLALGDYDEVQRLQLNKSESVDASEVGLALAFQTFPREKASFSNSEETLDFEFSNTGCPIIEVTINGIPKKLWLDTGASTSVLSKSSAVECGVNLGKSNLTATADNTQFEIGAATAYAKHLTVGILKIENHPLAVIADEMLQLPVPKGKATITIDGILGWNAIKHAAFYIDYTRKTVKIAKPSSKPIELNSMFTATRPIVSLKSSDQRVLRFGLDTGAGFSSISELALSSSELALVENRTVTIATVGGTKEIQSKEIMNQTLHTHNDQPLTIERLKVLPNLDDWATFFKLDGVLGRDAFENSLLKIDFSNGIVDLQASRG